MNVALSTMKSQIDSNLVGGVFISILAIIPAAGREASLEGACPIVGSYGAKDRANRGTAPKLVRR